MKNLLRVSYGLIAIIGLFILSSAFTAENPTTTNNSENSCTVYVKYSNGSPAGGVKVTTDVCESISCIGGRDFYTDKDGKATVKWASGCKICYLHIKGKKESGSFTNGGNYSFTVD